PETVDHPLEIGVERLRHHLRRPTHRRTEMTQSTRVTPLSGQTRSPDKFCHNRIQVMGCFDDVVAPEQHDSLERAAPFPAGLGK
ncbi:hypothetical protein, partial [Nocardia terrae]|uniref:hypothetical protein n=1 Tax=Nocardia terrae TaxID=2675851 RepID=UPI001A9B48C7